MNTRGDFITVERERIQAEYARRQQDIPPHRYAPWDPTECLFIAERKRVAARMLHRLNAFPRPGQRCLEIGFGRMGWLADLIGWGVGVRDLCGIELNSDHVASAQEHLPGADLRVGDAVSLPWEDESMQLVVMSTVLTSVLDAQVRDMIASQAVRVLARGGAVLWYDFAVNNPANPHVRGVNRQQVAKLFPTLHGRIQSVTLVPPLARQVTRFSYTLAGVLGAIPLLRTHLLAVLVKSGE